MVVRLLRTPLRMKHNATLALALAVAACSHNDRPAEPSAASVDYATNTPSDTDFTPPENRVDDTTATGTTTTGTPGDGTTTAGTTTTANTNSGTSALSPASGTTANNNNTTNTTTTSNTTTSNTTTSANTGAATPAAAGKKADNTAVNQRDRDDKSLTPMDQGESEADRKITQQVRQAVMKDGSLSFSAKNVKIITINGKVTLRGPVKTAEERAAIERAAAQVAGAGRVDNQLEIAK
jgi:osmotically-inducible protein OsmY